MKNEQFRLLGILAILGCYTSVVHASTSSEALAACKKHIAEAYEGELRTSVRRIRSRARGTEIKIKVNVDGEQFNAVCLVNRNGELAYSTDGAVKPNAIAAKDA